ncbi:unnamed protein product [Ambrosiozyma monospora]|uniref:Unnamed protein product n=1 Tax=Ambrosiozyma monospora TaxID=43982 RepID=A0ACB5U9U4_AMBMO|nr:unnamed protein product [Ambrosiozyma monospora]
MFSFVAILERHYPTDAQLELCFELRTKNSRKNMGLGEFRFKTIFHGDDDDKVSENPQYFLDVSGIKISNDGLVDSYLD